MAVDNQSNGDWGELQQLWQQTADGIDLKKLARHARWVWWRMRFLFAIDVIACLVGIGVFVSIFDASSSALTSFSLFGVLFCSAGLWAAFTVRRGAWGGDTGTALALVQLQVKRARSALLYIKLNVQLSYLALGLVTLGMWVIYDQHDTALPPDRPWAMGMMLGVGIILLVAPLIARPFRHRYEKRLAELETLEEQLSSED